MQTTIYIRKDNEDRWNALADKSAWVNDLLSKTAPRAQEPDHQPESKKPFDYTGTLDPLVGQATAIFEGKTCKNGHALPRGRDRCLTKGCKYS